MAEAKSRRTAIVNAGLTALALGLLAFTLWRNQAKILDVWRQSPDGRMLAAGLAVYVAALLVTFLRWHRLVAALGLPFRFRDAIRLGFIGNVFNLVIPGAVGGDLIKAAFLCREQERRTQAVASMVIDRAVGLLGLFVLAGAVGGYAWSGASVEVRRLIAFAWIMVICGVVGLAILFSPGLYRPLLRLFPESGKLGKVLAELVAMASAYRERIGVVALALAMATASHALFVLAFFLADRALFGAEAPGVLDHFLVVPLVLFSTAIPVPFGALGVSEGLSETLFRQMLGFGGGAVAMLGYRLLMYSGGLISVIVYVANLRQVRSLRPPGGEAELAGAS